MNKVEEKCLDVAGIVNAVSYKVTETFEDFIFEIVSPYLMQTHDVKVLSKEMLGRALLCFMQEHPDEYKQLIEQQVSRLGESDEADS
jgi:hypothetical protein